jgi:hypothetical protein
VKDVLPWSMLTFLQTESRFKKVKKRGPTIPYFPSSIGLSIKYIDNLKNLLDMI